MRIQSLHMENCRRHSLTDLEFTRGNWFSGAGKQGKTTIAEGLRLALTGRNRWTKFYQNEWHDTDRWIADGESAAQVRVTADGQVYSAHVGIKGHSEGGRAPRPAVDHKTAGVCLTTRGAGSFTQMSVPEGSTLQREQSKLLFGLLGEDVTPDVILGYMERWGKDPKVNLPDLAQWLMARPEFRQWPSNPCKTAQDARKRATALRDDRQSQYKIAPPPEPPCVTKEQVDGAHQRLLTLVYEAATLQERGKKDVGAQELYEEQHRSWESLCRQHRTAAAAVQRAEAGVPDTLGRELAAIVADLTAAKSNLEVARAEKQSAVAALGKVGNGPCPAGVCARIAAAQARDVLAEKEATVGLIERQRDDLVAEQRERESADRAQEALDEAVAAQAALPMLGVEPQPPPTVTDSTLDRDLAKARYRIAAAEEEVATTEAAHQAYRDWQGAAENHLAIGEQLSLYRSEVIYWKAAAEALAPNGIQAIILGKTAAALTKQMNELAAYFVDTDGKIMEMKLGTEGGVWVCDQPWDALCGSEEGLGSIVIQVLVARISGFNVVAIDEACIDPAQRVQLLKMLLDQKDLQWLVFSLANKMEAGKLLPPSPINRPDVSVFHVDRGEVHLVSGPPRKENPQPPPTSPAHDPTLEPFCPCQECRSDMGEARKAMADVY